MAASVMQLNCSCNNYPWGKKGKESLAARLCAKTPNTGFKIDEEKEYAEMWMGDYPALPAKVLSTGEDLHQVIDQNQVVLLGQRCIDKFGANLPFLPKILSIQKALTLQIHPDKQLSSRLHQENPQQFTDPNHKPEIAVALGPFEVFAGWKPNHDIQELFNLAPLQKFLPDKHIHFNNETLKGITQAILEASDETIADTQEQLAKVPKESLGKQSYVLDLLPRLQQQYSKQDPGILVALLAMNFLTLSANDAIYVPADTPHAYLSGDIVECMARSNNILNTGFCPRADRDSVKVFTAALTFSPHNAKDVLLSAQKSTKGQMGKTMVYQPPMSEFDMLKINLAGGDKEVIEAIEGPSVLISTKGSGKMESKGEAWDLQEGYVFFVGAGTELSFSSQDGMEIYSAYAE